MATNYTYTAEQLVFLNEYSKNDCVVLHRYGRTPSGQDPVHHVSLNCGVRYSIFPALSLNGYMAVKVIEGSIDGAEAALSSMQPLSTSGNHSQAVLVCTVQP